MKPTSLHGFRACWIGAALSACVPLASRAQLPVARLDSVFPAGVQAGTETEVSFAGENLDELAGLIFSHPGLTGEPLGDGRFRVIASPDVPRGLHAVRVKGRFGASNPRVFAVSGFQELREPDANRSADQAFPVELNRVVHGRAEAASEDWYRLNLRGGQRVLLLCEAERLESPMDATLVVSDAKGLELARNRDASGRDARLSFSAPADGEYFVRVFDFLYRGDGRYVYRLLATDQGRVEAVFPPFAAPGTEQSFRATGFALSDGLDHADIVAAPPAERVAGLGPGRFLHQTGIPGLMLDTGDWAGNAGEPLWLGVSESAPLLEGGELGGDAPGNGGAAQEAAAPCEIAGRFSNEGDIDYYSFRLETAQTLILELQYHRLGSPGDPVMTVEKVGEDGSVTQVGRADDDGVETGKPRFPFGSRDPVFRLQAEANVRYRIRVEDQFRLGDASRVYRLSIRPPKPSFALAAVSPRHADQNNQATPWSPMLRRGGAVDFLVYVLRKDGFDGAVDLRVENLPAGVSASPGRIGAGQDSGRVVLRASEDAPEWTGPVRVLGTAAIDGAAKEVEAVGAALLWPVGDFNNERMEARLERDIVLAVSGVERDPVELTLAGTPDSLEVPAGGSVEIPFRAVKHGEVKGEWKLRAEGIPGMGAPPETSVNFESGEAKLVVDLKETDKNKVGPGDYVMFVHAAGPLSYRANPEAAERTEAERKEREAQVQSRDAAVQEATKMRDQAAASLEALRASAQAGDAQAAVRVAEGEMTLSSAERSFQEQQQELEAAKRMFQEAEQRAKAAAERAQPKDLQHLAYGPAIRLKVLSPPDANANQPNP